MITPEEYAKLAALMDGVFKFKVGDVVQPAVLGDYVEKPSGHSTSSNKRESPHSWYTLTLTNSSTYRYVVIERWLQQCHGGIQKHYDIRLVDSRGLIEGPCRRITEGELTLAAPYKEIRGLSKKTFKQWIDQMPDEDPTIEE